MVMAGFEMRFEVDEKEMKKRQSVARPYENFDALIDEVQHRILMRIRGVKLTGLTPSVTRGLSILCLGSSRLKQY